MQTAETDIGLQSHQNQQHMRPEFRTPLTNVTAFVGQKIELDCTLIGEPRPSIFWKLNGKPLLVTDRVKVSFCICKIHIKFE